MDFLKHTLCGGSRKEISPGVKEYPGLALRCGFPRKSEPSSPPPSASTETQKTPPPVIPSPNTAKSRLRKQQSKKFMLSDPSYIEHVSSSLSSIDNSGRSDVAESPAADKIDQKFPPAGPKREGSSPLITVSDIKLESNERVDRWGHVFVPDEKEQKHPPTQTTRTRKPRKSRRNQEAIREQQWLRMIEKMKKKNGVETKEDLLEMKARIRDGIPDSVRGVVWPLLAGATDSLVAHPGLYQGLLRKKLNKDDDIQIRKDLPREFQTHIMFRSPSPGSRIVVSKGQASLYNVLKAYAIHDETVGYVQGMGSLAGIALMYMSEELSFWLMERLLKSEKYRLDTLYTQGMPLAFKYIHIHQRLLQLYWPTLYSHFEEEHVNPTSYVFRWMITRFAEFPIPLAVRIFDIFLNEGSKILFRIALYFLVSNESMLLDMKFEDITTWLRDLPQNLPVVSRTEEIIEGSLKLTLSTTEIQELGDSYDETVHQKEILASTTGPDKLIYIFPGAAQHFATSSGSQSSMFSDASPPPSISAPASPLFPSPSSPPGSPLSARPSTSAATPTMLARLAAREMNGSTEFSQSAKTASSQEGKKDSRSIFLRLLRKNKESKLSASASSPDMTTPPPTTPKLQHVVQQVTELSRSPSPRLAGGLNKSPHPVPSPLGKTKGNICFSD